MYTIDQEQADAALTVKNANF